MLKILIYFILFILAYCNHGFIIVYDTENSRSFQYRDCVYFMKEPEIPYCERPYLKPTEQKKMNTCAHSGEKWLFSDLIKSNITPNEVLKWSSAIEMAIITIHILAPVFYAIVLNKEHLVNIVNIN